jgi:hypothetical protein
MEVSFIALLMSGLEGIKHFLDTSFLFAFLKFFLFIYCAVLLVNIILLFSHRNVIGDLSMSFFQTKRPLARRNVLIKRWEAILARLETENESQYKAAVIEADAFADDVLKSMNYKGANMKERLDHIREYQLETKPQLAEAHALRNQIINDPTFSLAKEEVEGALDLYKAFFDEVELF